MSTHNMCFPGEIRKIFSGYPPLSRPMSLGGIILIPGLKQSTRKSFSQTFLHI